ncbi:hypothetical protein SCLCIDRAFT_1209841 [Scleroderma citrinum Foug A]|uniref:Uncharacterized protein n=1 Tax=Scleroderma citrinum Foug A TaxID=1036808 RepID=A0A0C3A242_9AGAM|nr:hypothetical protein SCLCIDRAFT_1209841 [Scleroderma citrinum Foug A]
MWSLSKQGTTLRRPRSINIAAAENNPNRLGYIQPWYNVSPGNGAVAVVLNDMRVDKHQDSKSATHDASRTAGLKTIKCMASRTGIGNVNFPGFAPVSVLHSHVVFTTGPQCRENNEHGSRTLRRPRQNVEATLSLKRYFRDGLWWQLSQFSGMAVMVLSIIIGRGRESFV